MQVHCLQIHQGSEKANSLHWDNGEATVNTDNSQIYLHFKRAITLELNLSGLQTVSLEREPEVSHAWRGIHAQAQSPLNIPATKISLSFQSLC